jgi:hypothetical protein
MQIDFVETNGFDRNKGGLRKSEDDVNLDFEMSIYILRGSRSKSESRYQIYEMISHEADVT